MKKIVFFRHGEYDKNFDLTVESAKNLFCTTKALKDEFGLPDIIFTSPVKRAYQTAEIISLVMDNMPLCIEPIFADTSSVLSLMAKKRLVESGIEGNLNYLLVVTHVPNIQGMLNRNLMPGANLMIESEEWEPIFNEKRISTPRNRIENHESDFEKLTEALHKISRTKCSEEDIARLSTIDFLKGRL